MGFRAARAFDSRFAGMTVVGGFCFFDGFLLRFVFWIPSFAGNDAVVVFRFFCGFFFLRCVSTDSCLLRVSFCGQVSVFSGSVCI